MPSVRATILSFIARYEFTTHALDRNPQYIAETSIEASSRFNYLEMMHDRVSKRTAPHSSHSKYQDFVV